MDVFGLWNRTIGEYRDCIMGFLNIGEERAYRQVEESLDIREGR